MLFSQFEFSLSEAWKGFVRGGLMTLIATFSTAVALLICGIFIILLVNIHHLTEKMGSQLEISVYLKRETPTNQIPIIKATFENTPGVKELTFISRADAWDKFQKDFPGIDFRTLTDDNPLPDTFRIKVEHLHQTQGLANLFAQNPNVEEVQSSGELAERMQKFFTFMQLAVIVLISFIVIATLFLVVNTIHLTVLARDNEIFIMQLVGATNSIIQGPFVLEGLLISLIAGSSAGILLKLAYSLLMFKIQEQLPFFPMTVTSSEVNFIFFSLFLFGLFLGGLGGYISVNRSMIQER
jgi:cell division transport system permease protein